MVIVIRGGCYYPGIRRNESVKDLPVECQPENDEKVVEQYQRSQVKVIQTHFRKSVSIDCLGMVHYELGHLF